MNDLPPDSPAPLPGNSGQQSSVPGDPVASQQLPPLGDLAPKPPLQAAPPSVLSTKVPSAVVLSIAVLMFLLPFIEIRCNNMPFAKFSGVQLATGFRIEMPGSNNTVTGRMGEFSDSAAGRKNEGNVYAIAALVLTVISLVLAFVTARVSVMGALVTAVLAAVALIALMVDVKNEVAAEVTSDDGVLISVNFAPAFYIAILSVLTGAFFCYKRLESVRL